MRPKPFPSENRPHARTRRAPAEPALTTAQPVAAPHGAIDVAAGARDRDRARARGQVRRSPRRRWSRYPVEAVEVAGRRAQWFGAPELAARNGTLLYLHGGAWCLHLPALYAGFAATLSKATGLRVLLVDYRLAPEHPFPAAIDDCLAAYRAMLESPHGGPVAIAGDSAGGSLTLVTLMRARDAQLPLPACAVLLSPSTDLTFSGPLRPLQRAGGPDVQCGLHEPAARHLLSGPGTRQPAAVTVVRELGGPAAAVFHRRFDGDAARRFGARATTARCRPPHRRASTCGGRCHTCFRSCACCRRRAPPCG